jgi:hypothetical protein
VSRDHHHKDKSWCAPLDTEHNLVTDVTYNVQTIGLRNLKLSMRGINVTNILGGINGRCDGRIRRWGSHRMPSKLAAPNRVHMFILRHHDVMLCMV